MATGALAWGTRRTTVLSPGAAASLGARGPACRGFGQHLLGGGPGQRGLVGRSCLRGAHEVGGGRADLPGDLDQRGLGVSRDRLACPGGGPERQTTRLLARTGVLEGGRERPDRACELG